jgi:hypothetical protein
MDPFLLGQYLGDYRPRDGGGRACFYSGSGKRRLSSPMITF